MNAKTRRRWCLLMKKGAQMVSLTEKAVKVINESLSKGKTVEIAVRNGKVVVWETSSKKKYEAIVSR